MSPWHSAPSEWRRRRRRRMMMMRRRRRRRIVVMAVATMTMGQIVGAATTAGTGSS
jgi:hypothetical protein